MLADSSIHTCIYTHAHIPPQIHAVNRGWLWQHCVATICSNTLSLPNAGRLKQPVACGSNTRSHDRRQYNSKSLTSNNTHVHNRQCSQPCADHTPSTVLTSKLVHIMLTFLLIILLSNSHKLWLLRFHSSLLCFSVYLLRLSAFQFENQNNCILTI